MKNIEFVLDEAIKLEIQSFELRSVQAKLFIESNSLSVKALKHKLKDEMDKYDDVLQLSLVKREEAYQVGKHCDKLREDAAILKKNYHEILNYFEQKEEIQPNLKVVKNGN